MGIDPEPSHAVDPEDFRVSDRGYREHLRLGQAGRATADVGLGDTEPFGERDERHAPVPLKLAEDPQIEVAGLAVGLAGRGHQSARS